MMGHAEGDVTSSVERKLNDFVGRKNIEERCTVESLEKLHEAFLAAEDGRMDEAQLGTALESILKINLNAEELDALFDKMNWRTNGFVTWDEFVGYALLEFRDKEAMSRQGQCLEAPFSGIGLSRKTRHRSAIIRILFCPQVMPDGSSSLLRGCYMTASKDGTINYWSLDLLYQRSVESTTPFPRVAPTVLTDFVAMPDVQMVCTSSSERDLRFYDVTAQHFQLRLLVTSLECAVVCMTYHFSSEVGEDSYLIIGDTNGSIIVASFDPADKGPFKRLPEQNVVPHHYYPALLTGSLKGLRVKEFKNVHGNWVSQVSYLESLRSFVSCSKCERCSFLVGDPNGTKRDYRFQVPKGISCFAFIKERESLVTGGPDCTIRTWNPFVTRKASAILGAHRAPINAIVGLNSSSGLCCSLSKDRCLKVWDIEAQTCIQTFNELPNEIGERTDLSMLYNDKTGEIILAGMLICTIVRNGPIDEEASDGSTHTQSVCRVLYNSVFKVIVTLGADSRIIVWNPWLGRRLRVVARAHERRELGRMLGVEITAGCFNMSQHLLLTGGRDGSIKMWNLASASCIRTMAIEKHCRVINLVWLKNGILCTGWDGRVREFSSGSDPSDPKDSKEWQWRHGGYGSCAAAFYPDAFASASYNGELTIWRLETGQPRRFHRVGDPTKRFKIIGSGSSRQRPRSKSAGEQVEKETKTVAARSIIFLTSRRPDPRTGSLLVSLESGLVQAWSHQPGSGGFCGAFTAVHVERDYVKSLATDPENQYLITGHIAGYIKVWLLANYAMADPPKVSVPLLRLEFPFMRKDGILPRAKRAVRDQPSPLLLSSVKSHTKPVNSLEYLPLPRIIISGSADGTVRLWSLGGRYVATLGTFHPWSTLLPDVPLNSYFKDYRVPPDLERVASWTSLKVLRGGDLRLIRGQNRPVEAPDHSQFTENEQKLLYGTRIDPDLFLQKYSEDSSCKSKLYGKVPMLDCSLAYIPVYAHLNSHPVRRIDPHQLPPAKSKTKANN